MTDAIEPITGPPTRLPISVCRTQPELGELRANESADGGMPTMDGHFSVFDNWYEINSAFEGRFLERIAPGSYKKTFADDASRKNAGQKIKVLLEHGHDPQVADKPLGVPRSLGEDDHGAAYSVPLLDTSYVRDLIPALEAGAYGSSFRFRVLQDEWVEEPEASDSNPDGIPERTIKEVRVMEFGPTMFPANPEASAGLRSTTDEYYEGLRRRSPEQFDEAFRSARESRETAEAARKAANVSTETSEPSDEVLTARSEIVTALLDAGFTEDQLTGAAGEFLPPVETPLDDVRALADYAVAVAELVSPVAVLAVRAADPKKPYGDVSYADPGYQKDKKKRYPLDSKDHAKSAWSYINQPGNASQYSSEDLAKVKASIMAACKKYGVTVADAKPAQKPAQKNSTTTPPVTPAGTPKTGAAAPATPRSRVSTPTPPKAKEVQRSARMDELTMTVAEREQRQAEIRTRLQEMDAEFNGAVLPEERQTEWDSISAEYEEHTASIAAANARAARLAALAGTGTGGGHTEDGTPFTPPNVIKQRSAADVYDITSLRRDARNIDDLARAMRDNALRAVELNHYDSARDDEANVRAHIESLLRRNDTKDGELARRILQTGSDTYDRAFGKACLAGKTDGLTNEERAALAVGVTTTGGFAVPFSLDPTVIMTNASVVNPIRQLARVIQISGKTWQGVTSAGISVARGAEAAEASDNSPTLAQPTLTPTRVQGFVPFSFEVDQDWAQMRGELGMMFDEAKDVEEATAFVTGTGVDPQPEGVITGVGAVGGSVIAGGTSVAFGAAEVYSLVDALPPRHVANASFLANKKVYNKVRQFDTQGGANLWARIAEGRPSRLVDFPVYEASTMSSSITATQKVLLLGDFKKFLIVDKIGMSVELIPHLFGTANNFPTGQRGLYAVWRNSSKVIDPNAFRLLQLTA
jgi:HK97 family phage major capsid protein/HK97 family phage prohead protease